MCILLIYSGVNESDNEYSYILASNRDEYYSRAAMIMAPWEEDPNVYGGRDLGAGCEQGTWLAISPTRKKIGVLLNLLHAKRENAQTRGRIVADFVKSEMTTSDYINYMEDYLKKCNDCIFVSIELGLNPVIQTYCNTTSKLEQWTDTTLCFGNCLPEKPLTKVDAAKREMKEICSRLNKIDRKAELIDQLISFLKSKEQHLPDEQLENLKPDAYKLLSSIFVEIPEAKYGTRTHTIILVTKTRHVDVIEITMEPPDDLSKPSWQRTEFSFKI